MSPSVRYVFMYVCNLVRLSLCVWLWLCNYAKIASDYLASLFFHCIVSMSVCVYMIMQLCKWHCPSVRLSVCMCLYVHYTYSLCVQSVCLSCPAVRPPPLQSCWIADVICSPPSDLLRCVTVRGQQISWRLILWGHTRRWWRASSGQSEGVRGGTAPPPRLTC